MSDIVQKLWGFCHTLRHDGVDYGDYIEQLTYLLFLKMADERGAKVPKDCDWESLKAKSGTQLTDHYADILRKLREAGGLLADVFAQATPRFNNPVNLKRVIAMIDEEDWSAMDVDVKGAAFEGLLEKAASEGKKGAGQYFTPRPLIQAIVSVMKPDPRGKTDSLLARAWTHSLPTRSGCALLLRRILFTRSQRVQIAGQLVPKTPPTNRQRNC